MPLNTKDRFDAYARLADYWADSYERRRQVEWKVSLGLWAVILTGIVNNDKLHQLWSPTFSRYLIGVWLAYTVLWLLPIQLKNKFDRDLSYEYLKAGTALVGTHGKERKWVRWLTPYSSFFHAVTTALLLFALNYSLVSR